MKNKLAAWIALGLIAVVSAACLAVTNEITRDVILEQSALAAEEARFTLVPDADMFGQVVLEEGGPADYLYTGFRAGEIVGYVAQVTVSGFGGPVEVIVGTDTEGVLNGIQVGGSNFSETAGLGAKAKEPAFTDQFAGKTAPLSVGEEIDAITAATITSNAVTRGVNMAIEVIGSVAGFEVKGASEGGALSDGWYTASVRGFAGPVYVAIQLNDEGVIVDIVIGNEEFAETAGFGQKAKEPAFYEQFIGRSDHVDLADIDAISGATITTKAVLDAVNTALLYAGDPEAAETAALAVEEFVLPEIPDDALTATASSKGFGGPVEVVITVDAAGETLLMVEFGGEDWQETDGIGSQILDEYFWHQFIGKSMPLDEDDIDLITGATITSQAAVSAVNKAYNKIFQAEETVAPTPTETPASSGDGNTVSASAKGFAGPVFVEITLDENGSILSLKIGDDDFAETAGFGAQALETEFIEQFIGKTPKLALEDIDAISGATITSEAVVNAINKAYDKLQGQ